jgi:polyphosphate kinase
MKNVPQIREISTLSFNERVLQEAEDARNPLLERLKFLGIFSSNMDEFFKVRVASIHRRIELGKKGMQELLEVIADKSIDLDERFRAAYAQITRDLAKEGVKIVDERAAPRTRALDTWLREYFRQEVLPGLVPIICDKNKPFPQLVDGALYLGIVMAGTKPRYAILEVPTTLPRFIELPDGNIMYIEDVIRHSLNAIFYIFEYDAVSAYAFKISRDAELDIDNDFSEGYVRKMERVLQQRKGGRPTRMVHDEAMPAGLLKILKQELHITDDDTVIPGGRYHNMRDLISFPVKRKDLTFPKHEPATHPVLDQDRRPMMDTIRDQDLMITYPYQSFDHVIRLLREAAIDPKVDAISITMYRAARNSQVVNALYNAARNGKKIFVSIELMARFDEENNIQISEKLAEVGATVVYGVPPMKVHSKLLLIQRKGQLIAGLSTGNFNESTGKLYVDSMLLTADKGMTADVRQVFTYLEHASRMRMLTAPRFKHLLVSPFNSRRTFNKLIAREQKKGKDGYIFIKVNHLTDPKILEKLRDAAKAGVRMDLVVRTTYALRPHENIRAISILDRYLEHQRVYIFGRGSDALVYMSSADLMERNLDWRVEVAFPILDAELKQHVIEMMAFQVGDACKARVLDANQSNPYVGTGAAGPRAQIDTYRYFRARAAGKAKSLAASMEMNEVPEPAPAVPEINGHAASPARRRARAKKA